MIEFLDVYKSFGPKKVLNGLSFKVQKGEIFFMLGKSGTGKSVALKHLVGLLKPSSGQVKLAGRAIQDCTETEFESIRRQCGIVFQLPALLDSRTVFENLSFGIRHESIKQRVAKIEKILPEVGLASLFSNMTERFPSQLSYGEQKRLAIARTLLIEPECVLFDEPTTGLDPVMSRSIHSLIKKISRNLGKTSVVVSHDMKNALNTADKIAVLDAGRVVDFGSPSEISKSSVPLTRDFLSDLHRGISK